MNRLIVADWRGQTDWNPELESGAPVQLFTPAVHPIDMLEEAEALQGSLESDARPQIYDPASDAFLIESLFGDFDANGPFGAESSELHPTDGAIVTTAAATEQLVDAFIALPHDDAFALPLIGAPDAFSHHGVEATFGGGDDPLWMLTLLPAPDDHIHDTGFGHPGLGIDPWG